MQNNILFEIRRDLQKLADPEIQRGQFHYFKEEILNYGIKVPAVSKLAGEYFKIVKDSGKPTFSRYAMIYLDSAI